MLHIENEKVRKYLLDGNFGLERENLRVTEDGRMSHVSEMFQDEPSVMRDFCENQVEINTGVCSSIEGAIAELKMHSAKIQKVLAKELQDKEICGNCEWYRGHELSPIIQSASIHV